MINRLNSNNFLGNPKPQKLQKSSVLVIFHTKSQTYRPNVYTMYDALLNQLSRRPPLLLLLFTITLENVHCK